MPCLTPCLMHFKFNVTIQSGLLLQCTWALRTRRAASDNEPIMPYNATSLSKVWVQLGAWRSDLVGPSLLLQGACLAYGCAMLCIQLIQPQETMTSSLLSSLNARRDIRRLAPNRSLDRSQYLILPNAFSCAPCSTREASFNHVSMYHMCDTCHIYIYIHICAM